MQVAIVEMTGGFFRDDAEYVVEFAGRVCYKSKGIDTKKFVQNRIKEGHDSILEHASITFDISGISRACSHQLVRHRIASYSQESQRYVDMSNFEFVTPPSIEANTEALDLYQDFITSVDRVYSTLRGMGIRREDARFVLPNAAQTRIIVTMNYRSLRHFFKVRLDKAAQWEIRKLALAMLSLCYDVAPFVFEDLYNEHIGGEYGYRDSF